jgi:hypothetical protein
VNSMIHKLWQQQYTIRTQFCILIIQRLVPRINPSRKGFSPSLWLLQLLPYMYIHINIDIYIYIYIYIYVYKYIFIYVIYGNCIRTSCMPHMCVINLLMVFPFSMTSNYSLICIYIYFKYIYIYICIYRYI